MEIVEIIFLSIIQGITEFLPISSSGHLVLFSSLFLQEDHGMLFDISVHFGTLLAALIYFRSDLFNTFNDLQLRKTQTPSVKLFKNLLLATLPILLIGYLLKEIIQNNLRMPAVIGWSSIIFGILLYLTDRFKVKELKISEMNSSQSLFVGLCQCFALIPGASRSGVAISAGLVIGLSREDASRFSFLLAIPTIFFIAISSTFEVFLQPLEHDLISLFLGILLSFATAYLTIDIFLKLIEKIGFLPFIIYRTILGFAVLIYLV
tara:strand:- start:27374 stop:28162 length:789 start_codon:yes stop_codon:yes gene_type:complete